MTLSWMGTWSEPVRRYFFVGRDMTESRLAQETLRESEQLARGIIDTKLVNQLIAPVVQQTLLIGSALLVGTWCQRGGARARWLLRRPARALGLWALLAAFGAHFSAVALPAREELPAGAFRLTTRRGKQFNTIVHEQKDAITGAQRDTSLNALLADLANGVLVTASPPLTEVLTEAERLSALHSDTLGTRSLDILHVAAAVVLGSREFLTFDRRQANLARAAGQGVAVVDGTIVENLHIVTARALIARAGAIAATAAQ